jgi:hypothetical protein
MDHSQYNPTGCLAKYIHIYSSEMEILKPKLQDAH